MSYNSASTRDISKIFVTNRGFGGLAIGRRQSNFTTTDSCSHGNDNCGIWSKNYNRNGRRSSSRSSIVVVVVAYLQQQQQYKFKLFHLVEICTLTSAFQFKKQSEAKNTVSTRPTRRYCPARSNRFIARAASSTAFLLSYCINAQPLQHMQQIIQI